MALLWILMLPATLIALVAMVVLVPMGLFANHQAGKVVEPSGPPTNLVDLIEWNMMHRWNDYYDMASAQRSIDNCLTGPNRQFRTAEEIARLEKMKPIADKRCEELEREREAREQSVLEQCHSDW